MKDQMREAFCAWVTSDDSPVPAGTLWDSEEVKGYWRCWQAATAHNAAANDAQLQRLRTSLTRLLEVDKQLQDLLPRKVD